jgi:hypothetical protein
MTTEPQKCVTFESQRDDLKLKLFCLNCETILHLHFTKLNKINDMPGLFPKYSSSATRIHTAVAVEVTISGKQRVYFALSGYKRSLFRNHVNAILLETKTYLPKDIYKLQKIFKVKLLYASFQCFHKLSLNKSDTFHFKPAKNIHFDVFFFHTMRAKYDTLFPY